MNSFFRVPMVKRDLLSQEIAQINSVLVGGYAADAKTLTANYFGSIVLPVGFTTAQIISEDGFFTQNNDIYHTIDTLSGLSKIKVLELEGNMTLNIFGYYSDTILVQAYA